MRIIIGIIIGIAIIFNWGSIKEYFDEKEEDPAIEIIDNEILSDELYEEVDDSDEDDLKKKS